MNGLFGILDGALGIFNEVFQDSLFGIQDGTFGVLHGAFGIWDAVFGIWDVLFGAFYTACLYFLFILLV